MVISKMPTKFISKSKNLRERDKKISLDPKHHFAVSFYKNSDLNIPEDVDLVERNLGTGMESDLQRHRQMGSVNQILKKPPNILKNKGRNFKVRGLFKVPISEAMNRIVDSLKSTLAVEDLMESMEIDGKFSNLDSSILDSLVMEVSNWEIQKALFNMGPLKALRLDGLYVLFSKSMACG
ncbi:hypothetical protein ES288_D13G192200v1 [Gossypium darwinii]|uniref:Uncharacterized protein n=1 Tax=Gossypium darwinii TaxID=34276 RepID=A0A5D2A0X0_GOSDA|nr:hypothetical protein ES288_D13G192200v1 [Gossypium darwinii]